MLQAYVAPLLALPLTAQLALAAALVLPLVWWLLTRDVYTGPGKLPPQLNVLWRAVTGQFSLAEHGPLAVVQAGYDEKGDIFRVKAAHRGLTFVIGPAGKLFFGSSDLQLSQREVYTFTVPVFGKNIVYDAPPGVMIQQVCERKVNCVLECN